MRLYGLCKTGSLGVLACRGGHQSRRYRRLWPRQGRMRLVASFRQSPWLSFQRGGPAAAMCCVWVYTQTAHHALVRARLLHVRSYSEFSPPPTHFYECIRNCGPQARFERLMQSNCGLKVGSPARRA